MIHVITIISCVFMVNDYIRRVRFVKIINTSDNTILTSCRVMKQIISKPEFHDRVIYLRVNHVGKRSRNRRRRWVDLGFVDVVQHGAGNEYS